MAYVIHLTTTTASAQHHQLLLLLQRNKLLKLLLRDFETSEPSKSQSRYYLLLDL